jgi:hypothetical protein
MRKITNSENLILFVMVKRNLNFFMKTDTLKITSCKHPRGQIQPQKILFPKMVKSIMAAAIMIMGGGRKPLKW